MLPKNFVRMPQAIPFVFLIGLAAVSLGTFFLLEPQVTAASPIDEVKTTLTSTGFEPAEIIRDAGAFRLAITNTSNTEELTFRLTKPNGQEVYRSQPTTGAAGLVAEFNLPAGRYILSVVGHPEWVYKITLL